MANGKQERQDAGDVPPTPPHRPEYFNIVVLGAMNPQIHTPFWYGIIGEISESDAENATEVVVVPGLSRFSAAGVTILCTADRWEIGTTEHESRSVIVKIACAVFERLNETPVRAIGFNTLTDLEVQIANVPGALATLATATGLSFDFGDSGEAQFTFTRVGPYRKTIAGIVPSTIRTNMVHIRYNTEITFKPTQGYRSLTPEFTTLFEPHVAEALDFGGRVVARLSEIGKA